MVGAVGGACRRGGHINEERGEVEVRCLQEVRHGLRVRVVEVLGHVDGCGGAGDRAEVPMAGPGGLEHVREGQGASKGVMTCR